MFSNIILIFSSLFLTFNFFFKEKYNNFFSISSIFTIIIIFVLLFLIFQKDKIKNCYTLLISSVYITLFLINFVIKTFYFETQIEEVKEHNKKKISLRPAVFPSLFYENYDMQILSGLSNQNTIYCKEDDFFTIYKSDRYGFNNSDNVYDRPEKVFLLGDSFTHGACVKEGDDIAGALRKKNINAINLGMGGNSEISKLATFKEYAIKLNPKYILWMYTNGDLGGTIKELNNKNINKYFYDQNYSQDLLNRNSDKDIFIDKYLDPIETKESKDYYLGLFTFYDLRKYFKNFILPKLDFGNFLIKKNQLKNIEVQKFDYKKSYLKSYTDKNLKVFSSILNIVKNDCYSAGCEVIFVFMPSNKILLEEKESFYLKHKIFHEVKKLNIKIIDTEPEFLKLDDINDYMIGHYNAKGYEIVAKEISKILNQ